MTKKILTFGVFGGPKTTIDIIVISPLDNFPILLIYINNDLEKTSDYISV
jgi:hypothetical protein